MKGMMIRVSALLTVGTVSSAGSLLKKTVLVFWFAAFCASAVCGAAQERIEVRGGRFSFADSGAEFMPYGVNYCRLDNKWHSVFSIDCYDAERFEAMLADLKGNHLNVVRIFLDHRHERKGSDGAGGGIATDGFEFSETYIANMIDGLERAQKHGIYVILCLNGQPISKAYQGLFSEPVPMVENDMHPFDHPVCSLGNMQYFHPGAIRARAEYFKRVVQAIADHDSSLLATVFSYELGNESYFVGKAPLNLRSGTFTFLGRDYDMAQDRELRRLMDDAAVHWANSSAAAIRLVDPKAMVSVNVFTYQAVGRKNLMAVRPDQGAEWDKKQRIPVNLKALADSSLDYLDVHIYLHRIGESSVAEKLEETLGSIDYVGLSKAARRSGKPLIVGEYAAFKDPERTLEQQEQDVIEQMDLCRDRGFQGFLYWTYDTDEQTHIHNLKMNDGRMLDVMAEWVVGSK
jgi:hypothetical protein